MRTSSFVYNSEMRRLSHTHTYIHADVTELGTRLLEKMHRASGFSPCGMKEITSEMSRCLNTGRAGPNISSRSASEIVSVHNNS